jgi:glycerophosphoryl diester phosphodiesterase
MPAGTSHRGTGQRRLLRIAHRGASAHAPENTLAAIAKAAQLGGNMVELDVRASADGVPVIIHDADLSGSTNGSGAVSARRVDELKQLDAGNGERIPTLDEAVACCHAHNLGIYLELKVWSVIPAVVEAIGARALHDEIIVASFRPDWLAEVKALDPTVATSILFSSVHLDPVALARSVRADYVHPAWEAQAAQPHKLLTPEWLSEVRAAGLRIISWHEERPAEIAALRALGVDGICTNAPELLGE